MKRLHDEVDISERSSKRLRTSQCDRLSLLSDELLLRTLSYLTVSELVICERLSRRLHALAGDLQLWKALFYDRFVRPRASRIPGRRDKDPFARTLHYSSKLSKWLDDDYLVSRGTTTNWKRQYKLRHNWSRGSAHVSEIRVAEQPSTPPLLVRLHNDIIVTADASAGLRAWSLKGDDRLIATTALSAGGPTSLAIDDSDASSDGMKVSVGFGDSSFAIFTLSNVERTFVHNYQHAPSMNGAIHAIAYASPYLLTMTEESMLSLYRADHLLSSSLHQTSTPPKLLCSLRSRTAYPPISLALRVSHVSIIASMTYAMPTWTKGWSIGLQELRLTKEGIIEDSRVASARPSLISPRSAVRPPLSQAQSNDGIHMSAITRPTSMSYNHPYLLSSHEDNTLTLYMVTSNAKELSIGVGHRLWGHTSSVSGAHVGDRGKAVSVSAFGNELRVWELEGGLASNIYKRRAAAGEISVQVRPENIIFGKSRSEESAAVGTVGATLPRYFTEQEFGIFNGIRGWVTFDEEKVVLLKEEMLGAQALAVYDFS